MQENERLDRELDSNIDIIREFEGVNEGLVREVRDFCAGDEKVKETLSRTARLEETIREVHDRISRTGREIRHILY
jgi:hypothetical protein